MSGMAVGLGIDAGGTQTRWALADAAGVILAEGTVGGLTALLAASEEGRQRMQTTLAELAAAAHARGVPLRACAGMTGLDAGNEAIRELIAHPLGLSKANVTLHTDIEIACRDVFAPGEGYLVYAGTGSVAAFIDDAGHFHRAGGRGAILDDAGAGFWIACEALRHVWRAEDERPGAWAASPMAVELFRYIGGSDWSFSRKFVYGADQASARGEIGKLALAVAATADSDPEAHRILQSAGVELARLGRAMIARFGARPVALAGRVVELHPAIADSMRNALPENTPFQIRKSEAHHAAARIAAKSPGGSR
jgi:N-acetylglucosamine kinase-like BadF-type ATPase